MLGKVYKGYFPRDYMNNKIVLTIFVTIFLMGFIQAEVFGTPETTCPAQVICETPEEIVCGESNYFFVIIISLIVGALIAILLKSYGKGLFSKKKKKTILNQNNEKATDLMFEKALNDSKNFENKADSDENKGFRW